MQLREEENDRHRLDFLLIIGAIGLAHLYPLLWVPFRLAKSPFEMMAVSISRDLITIFAAVVGIRGISLTLMDRRGRRELLSPRSEGLYGILLVLLGWISLFQLPGNVVGLGVRHALMLTGGFGVYLLVKRRISGIGEHQYVLWTILLCTLVVFLSNLAFYLRGISIGKYAFTDDLGILFHPNVMGTMLVTAIVISVSFFFLNLKNRWKFALGLAILLFLFGLLLTRSRTAVGSLFVSGVILGLIRLRGRKRICLAVLALGVMGSVTALVFLFPQFADRYLMAGVRFFLSMQHRMNVWKASFALAFRSPILGKGLGSFILLPKELYEGPYKFAHTHNQYIQFLLTMGIPGLACFLAFLFQALKGPFRGLRSWVTRDSLSVVSVEIMIVMIYLVSFLFASKLVLASANVIFFTFMGMSSAWLKRVSPGDP